LRIPSFSTHEVYGRSNYEHKDEYEQELHK
jgi:hypothetical protein